MGRKLCVILGSEDSGQSVQTLSQDSAGKPPEVEILGVDTLRPHSASTITITYEGGGTFTIRSGRGSKIAIQGRPLDNAPVVEEPEAK